MTNTNEQDATGDFDDDDNYAKGDTLTDIENIIGSNVSSGNTNDMYDELTGDGSDNVIDGRSGNDTLGGGAGDDTLIGGRGDDRLTGGNDADTFKFASGDGADTITDFNSDDDQIDLTAYRSLAYITTDADNNSVIDLPGSRDQITLNVTVDSLTEADIIFYNRDADNTLNGDNNDNRIWGGAGNDRIDGRDGEDTLTGGPGNDMLFGGDDDDDLDGGEGDDTLEGGPGADTFTGDSDDFLSYESSSSSVRVDLNDGTTTDSITYIMTVEGGDARVDEVVSNQFQNIIGSRGSDTLTGDDNDNELDGRGGNDTLTGNDGNDTLKGGERNDTLKGGEGNDTLDGGPDADTLDGGGTELAPGSDTATYASATESVTVDLSGGNRGQGDAAGDTFTGIEQYMGSAHDDTFIAGKDTHNINGGGGSDTVSYERSVKGVQVSLTSTAEQAATGDYDNEDNYAKGDELDNIENVIGSSYADQLTAHGNGSVINGGKDDDRLTGNNGGSDTFKFASGDGDDEVFSFETDADKIDLSAFSSIASMEDLDINPVGANNENTEIDLPGGGEITIYGVADDDLTPDNFIFHDRPVNGTSSSNVLEGDLYNNTMDGQKAVTTGCSAKPAGTP